MGCRSPRNALGASGWMARWEEMRTTTGMSRGLTGTPCVEASSWGVQMERLSDGLVAVYASLFVHCWGQYAVQQGDGSYWRVAEPLTLPPLVAHVEGRWTLGT